MKPATINAERVGHPSRPGHRDSSKWLKKNELGDHEVLLKAHGPLATAKLLDLVQEKFPGADPTVGNRGATLRFKVPTQVLVGIHSCAPGIEVLGAGAEVDTPPSPDDTSANTMGLYELMSILRALGHALAAPPPPASDLMCDPSPWHASVDTSLLLDEYAGVFRRHLVVEGVALPALALWGLYTFAHDDFNISSYLALWSAVKRCGKSLALECLGGVTRRPIGASNISAPATYRTIHDFAPTLLLDEYDRWLGHKEELIGILNSGHTRATAYVLRAVGPASTVMKFSTWCPKVMAGIGELPDTLKDRSVVIQLLRKTAGEKVQRIQGHDRIFFAMLQSMALRWSIENEAWLSLPHEYDLSSLTSDRAKDVWAPLFAIAELAGEHWTEKARAAAKYHNEDTGDEEELRILLLEDLHQIFNEDFQDPISSTRICGRLRDLEDRPWSSYPAYPGIKPHNLAFLLKRFKIYPQLVRKGSTTFRGYRRADFQDAWNRYTPTLQAPPAPSVTALHALR